jgi:hypothetical protein
MVHIPQFINNGSSGSGGGGGDLPNVTGVIAWYDADSTRVTKDGSNKVSRIEDRSATDIDVTQSTGVNQPEWFDNQINGQPAIQSSQEIFLGSEKTFLFSESLPSPNVYDLDNAVTMVTVFMWNTDMNNTSDIHMIFGNTETSTANEGYAQYLRRTSDESHWFLGDDGTDLTRLDIVKDTWYYMIGYWDKDSDSGTLTQTIAGVGTDTDTRTSAITSSDGKLGFGGGNSVSLRGFGGMIAETILIDHKVSASEKTEIDSYINTKYGL